MKVALISSHGGHMTELLALSDAWADAEAFWVTYRSRRTLGLPRTYLLENIGTNPVRMMIAAMRIGSILLKERPDVVVSTGAEIAIPAFYLARLLGIRTIFIEVWTRVRRPTGTGLLVYPVTDLFFVQWPQLLRRYGGRAQYAGSLL